ncbi:radical SAM protein [bacterium]|nr:radical SAM protein [candidate division CSSED10-310 bacterium]
MRIFLGNPPWNEGDMYGVRAGSRWPHLEDKHSHYLPFPFFMAYTAAVLEQHGYYPRMVDAIAERLTDEAFLYAIEKSRPELLILEVSTPSFIHDLELLHSIRQRFGKDIRIALCGPNHLMVNSQFLENNPDIDFVMRGEYEYITLELVKILESGGDPGSVPGLNFRDGHGTARINPPRELLGNIDSIPWPSRHQLPMMNYYDEAGGIVHPSAQMWASRGCPHQCIFCVWPQLVYGGPNYRVRNPDDVAEEMAWLVNTYNYRSVYFDDDTFNIGKNRMLRLCDAIRKRNVNIPWSIMARADGMDRDVLERMREAGLYSVKYGIESGEQSIVNASGKNLDLTTARETIRLTRELGIKYHLTFTFGLPGETKETARRTLDMALELDPETVQFSICTPMPGSKYYDMAREKGYINDSDWDRYTGFNSAVIRTDALTSSDLEEILVQAQQEWYLHREARAGIKKNRSVFNRISGFAKDIAHGFSHTEPE